MGRSEDNISFRKTPPTMHVAAAQHGSSTLPAGYSLRQNFSPLLESGQLSAYSSAGAGQPAQIPGGVPNGESFIEYPAQWDTASRPFNDTTPVFVAPFYGSHDIAQSYESNVTHILQQRYEVSPTGTGDGSSASSSARDQYRLDVGRPARGPGDISNINFAIANPVPSRQGIAFQPSSDTPVIVVPPYGGNPIAQSYGGDARHFSQLHVAESSSSTGPAYLGWNIFLDNLAPPYPPSPSPSSISSSRTDTPHPSTQHPSPSADHTPQAPSLHEQHAHQPSALQVFKVGDYLIDGDDLADQSTDHGSIIIGECLRTDSPCRLWVKVNKGSLKRHAQKWHGVTRGDETSKVPCTWDGCNIQMQKSAVARHTLRRHFGETFRCNGCSRLFSRDYSWRSHAKMCKSGGNGYRVMYGRSTRIVNVTGVSLRQVGQ
ncbi:uncharacterized protein EDB91DRAFT_1244913 [Suillus paluster]|uniref:uncharacterized protein n=1 Tax=Suillus paluster TaxID=48578 RepID=UPI001B885FF3|nr:uncharacterized protein EDB91DRAFT_1244913 [Suillus paluster]KAG1749126.1 hypothetical protein EDB91DRAFT_1244913 [Suillus paluster]